MAGIIGAPLTIDFVIHFERVGTALRVSEKRELGSMGTGSRDSDGTNMQLHFYEYNVYCDRNELVGQVLQAAIMKDMGSPDQPELFRPGGLCSVLTMRIHPGLSIEYRGRQLPVEMAQTMAIGTVVTDKSEKRLRLIGKMDIFACLPCCCLIPKLLKPDTFLPWKQYEIFDPKHTFAPNSNAMTDRGAEAADKSKSSFATAWPGTTPASGASATKVTPTPTKQQDIESLNQLKASGVLTQTEFASKMEKVNSNYGGTERDIQAITNLFQQGILSQREFVAKKAMILSLHD